MQDILEPEHSAGPSAERTTEEIDALKASWRRDPCWDIETTEGFEAYRDELHAYRLECEAEWRRQHMSRLAEKAAQIGAPGNFALAEYVIGLEHRIKELEASR